METWFSVTPGVSWGKRVEAVQVEKSTDKTLLVGGRRVNRMSDYRCFFPTEREAWDHLIQHAQQRVQQASATLQKYRSELGKIESERATALGN
jgi:hypothetical protein